MKLLILTQKVDRTDPVLGFFHNWLIEFTHHAERMTVVCLEKGVVELPHTVTIHSLGKEKKQSRIRYIFNFYRYVWRERNNYDAVFVHMNTEYVLLGSWMWKLLRKPIVLWYNHAQKGLKLRMAILCSDKVLHTSPFAAPAGSNNAKTMPVGIDTELFKKDAVERRPNSLLFLGRIAPIKGLDVLIDAAQLLSESKIPFTLDIYGDALPRDREYDSRVRKTAKALVDSSAITFLKGIPNDATPAVYNSHELFINLSPNGLFDKTMLEAMACESLVLVSSRALANVLPSQCLFNEGDSEDLKSKIETLLKLSKDAKEELGRHFREYVTTHHSLKQLSRELFSVYTDLLRNRKMI